MSWQNIWQERIRASDREWFLCVSGNYWFYSHDKKYCWADTCPTLKFSVSECVGWGGPVVRMAADFRALTASAPSKVSKQPPTKLSNFSNHKYLKVILHGEHAVVYGMTAVGASLELRTSITIKPHPSKVSPQNQNHICHQTIYKPPNFSWFKQSTTYMYTLIQSFIGCGSLSRLGPQWLLDNSTTQRAFYVSMFFKMVMQTFNWMKCHIFFLEHWMRIPLQALPKIEE